MKYLFLLLLLLSFQFAFGQQRVGVEVSSRLEDLSCGLTFQKAVKNRFLYGGGLVLNGKFTGYDDYSNEELHNPFNYLPNEYQQDTTVYSLNHYSARSGLALGLQAMSGTFFELSDLHGIRLNLNFRFSWALTKTLGFYSSMMDPEDKYVSFTGWNSFQTLSPEIYHTLRQSNKWTFYYGLRLPMYMQLFPKQYSPVYKTDIYTGIKLELAIGITRHIGKEDPDYKSREQK